MEEEEEGNERGNRGGAREEGEGVGWLGLGPLLETFFSFFFLGIT